MTPLRTYAFSLNDFCGSDAAWEAKKIPSARSCTSPPTPQSRILIRVTHDSAGDIQTNSQGQRSNKDSLAFRPKNRTLAEDLNKRKE